MVVLVISGRRQFLVPARIPSRFPGMNVCRPLPQASFSFTLHFDRTVCRLSSTFSKLLTTSEKIVYASLPLIPVEATRGSCFDNRLLHIVCCRLLPKTILQFHHLPIFINSTEFWNFLVSIVESIVFVRSLVIISSTTIPKSCR